jgi:hypothetical protein
MINGLLDFSTIDTEEKAYLLGLYGADGNVFSAKNQVSLYLAGEDGKFLEKVKMIMGIKTKITESRNRIMTSPLTGKKYATQIQYTLRVSSSKLCNEFIKHNIVPAKSKILSPPSSTPKNLIRHYIRGYVDGDGSVVYRNRNSKCCVYSGSKRMLDYIQLHFRDYYPNKCKVLSSRNTYVLGYANYSAYQFVKFLYSDCSLSLPRKYRNAVDIIQDYETNNYKPHIKTYWSAEEIAFLQMNYGTIGNKQISLLLDRSIASIVWKAGQLGIRRITGFGGD